MFVVPPRPPTPVDAPPPRPPSPDDVMEMAPPLQSANPIGVSHVPNTSCFYEMIFVYTNFITVRGIHKNILLCRIFKSKLGNFLK